MLAIVLIVMALLAAAVSGTARMASRIVHRRAAAAAPRGLAFTWAIAMVALALRVWLNRFDLLFEEHTIFSGVGYTDAHITIAGMTLIALRCSRADWSRRPARPTGRTLRWLVFASPSRRPRLCRRRPHRVLRQQLHRQAERAGARAAVHRAQHRVRRARPMASIVSSAARFRRRSSVEAADPANNQATMQNVRLWDWRVLQDTLRQLQEIRTYYDFPDIDIDRYTIDGTPRQVMLAARELNIEKLPDSSRNWINEKLIYTHGYGVTMNYVNGFTPEGLPKLLLKRHAGAEHCAGHHGHASGDLLRRDDRTPTSTSIRGSRNSIIRRGSPTASLI